MKPGIGQQTRDFITGACAMPPSPEEVITIWNYIRELIRDEMTSAMHPEFGWFWRADEDGGKAMRAAYVRGWNDHAQGREMEPGDV